MDPKKNRGGRLWLALSAIVGAVLASGLQAAPRQPEFITDQYIVTLRKPAANNPWFNSSVMQQANQLAAMHGGNVNFVYETVLRGFSIRLSAAQAQLLAQSPMVASVEQDQRVYAVASESPAVWGIDRSDQRDLPLSNSYNYPDQAGTGVHVYVLDTGINPDHNEFTGRVGESRNFVSSTVTDWKDCNGHGTHVSGTAAGTTWGVAKKATIHAMRVLNCQGSGTTSGVIAGIDWVANNHLNPAVANMSLGGGASTSLDNAVKNAIGTGVTFVVAAGNDNANACNSSPSRVPEAITVGATTNSDVVASYSNRGSCLDIFAPGSNVVSANYSNNTGSSTLSGTSMATPHVTGAIALYLGANSNRTPAQLRDTLVNDATSGKLSGTGASGSVAASPNLLLYVGNVGGGNPNVDNPPVASFTVSCNGLSCDVNGNGSTDDHGVSAYSWDFGDSSGGSGATLNHSYASAGTYSIKLTVTDTTSQTNATSKSVTVSTTTAPCTDCTKVSGSLAANGTAYHTSSAGFSSGGGTFKGWLRGPNGADYDLYLEKRISSSFWYVVARAEGNSASEDISYNGSSGTYRWRVRAYSGSGAYDFYYKNP